MKAVRPIVPHPFDPLLALVPLDDRGERHAVIDVGDVGRVSPFNWFGLRNGRDPYAARNIRRADGSRRTQYLHLFLWDGWGNGRPERLDHANRNTLDCRRENLRAATHQQNVWNSRKPRGASTEFKGVYVNRRNAISMYTAVIRENKRQIWIGSFVTAEEAARAYDVHARRVHGAFAALNFPETN